MMAGMIFEMDVFFHGTDNVDQLVKILEVLGSRDFQTYLSTYRIVPPDDVMRSITGKNFPKIPFSKFAKDPSKSDPLALDLLGKLLRYDHHERLTAEEAMHHPYFEIVRHF